jgi:hypothetical protein
MVFFITAMLLVGYGLNMVTSIAIIIGSDDSKTRGRAVLAIFIGLLAAAGVLYLASH